MPASRRPDPSAAGPPGSERVSAAERQKHAPDHVAVAGLMRRQTGVIAMDQLRELGFSDHGVGLLVAQGRLRRLHRGVYGDALVALPAQAHLLAAQLALGPSSFLSHRTAAALHGLRPTNLHAIEATVSSGHTPKRQGLIVRRTAETPHPSELRCRGPLRFSSVARMLLELAPRETEAELDRLLAESVRRRLVQLELIDAAVARRGKIPGLSRLTAALARYVPPSAHDVSTFERAFADWLATLPAIPAPARYVTLGPWEIDFLWPVQQVAVETDGAPYHCTPAELERDRVKDAWLQRHGYRVLRVTGFRFDHDRTGIQADLTAMLDAR